LTQVQTLSSIHSHVSFLYKITSEISVNSAAMHSRLILALFVAAISAAPLSRVGLNNVRVH
jgi:hypothetical protein